MTPKKLSVAVVQGGPSSEAEVSRQSAAGVAKALAEAGHAVVRLELDAFLAESLRSGAYDVAFPVVHGAVGEDGCLQGLFEVLELPYVGSNVLASAMAMSKRVARRIFEAEGLPVAKGLAMARGDAKAAAERARREIGARLVVKPSSHGSAIGVTRVEASAPIDELARAFETAWALDDVAIVEHFAKGREVTCGVLDLEGGAVALPPTEIIAPMDAFYTFEARYAPGRSRHACPAPLPPHVTARVREVAVAAHRALGCRDLSRADFVVGDADANQGTGDADANQGTGDADANQGTGDADTNQGTGDDGDPDRVFLLEVNTLPGMTATSLYPEAAAVFGKPFPALCDALVRHAHARGPTKRAAPLKFPGA